MLGSRVYLDNNATTPLRSEVIQKMSDSFKYWANPSSNNENATVAAQIISESRCHLAEMFHTKPEHVIFTSGGTESNNWIIDGAIKNHQKSKGSIPHVVTTTIEHPSIVEPLKVREQNGQISVTYVPVDLSTGFVPVQNVVNAVTENTCLVTVMLANNETGVLQPVRDIFTQIKKKFRNGPICHSDVAQAAGKIEVNIEELNADAITVVGHKFYGPRIGALIYNSPEFHIPPLLYGGNQENGWRSGTENTPMIVGLGEAARVYNERSKDIEEILRKRRDEFETLIASRLPSSHKIHFATSPRLPNTSSIAFLNYSPHSCDLVEKAQSFYASTGAACHKNECSPILTACGIPFETASKTVRFSFGCIGENIEIEKVVEELVEKCK